MLFHTPEFVLTLLAFLIIWFLLPNRFRKFALLVFSYYYAWLLGGWWTVITLGAVTLLTYGWGFLAEKTRPDKKGILVFVLLLVLLLMNI